MREPGPGRPEADECLPYYFQYIRLVPDGHVVDRLERQIDETAAYLGGFTRDQALRREAPAEWCAVEIVGHLVDTERVFRAPEGWTMRSVRAAAYAMAGHELHHVADIRRQHAGAAGATFDTEVKT